MILFIVLFFLSNFTNCMLYNNQNQIKHFVFEKYQKYALYHSYKFRKTHYYLAKNIRQDDFHYYAYCGLYHAICNYNQNFDFVSNSTSSSSDRLFLSYSKTYILGELYKGLTQMYPISNLPKTQRKLSSLKNPNKKYLETIMINDNNWIMEQNGNDLEFLKSVEYNDLCMSFWEKIRESDLFSQKIFRYKYNFQFEKQMSNREIAMWMGCSEEYVRRILRQKTKMILSQIL